MNQEYIMQIQQIEQEINQLSSQSSLIDQNINELNDLKLSLNELETTKNNEILVNLGKKIFMPVNLKDNFLFVEVGDKKFVKKSFNDTILVINEQLKKLTRAKVQLNDRLTELQEEAQGIIDRIESNKENLE